MNRERTAVTSTAKTVLILIATLTATLPLIAPATENGADVTDQRHYISDIFYVPLRSGPSNKHRITHKGLKSGEPLTLLEADSENGYSRIRTDGGSEGWLPNQYLSTHPIARQRLSESLQQQRQLQQQLQETKKQRDELQENKLKTETKLALLSQKNQQISGKLARIERISAHATALDANHRALLAESELLQIEIAELQAENARLNDKSDKEWFLRGGFAVVLGALLVALLPRLKSRQKRHGDWL